MTTANRNPLTTCTHVNTPVCKVQRITAVKANGLVVGGNTSTCSEREKKKILEEFRTLAIAGLRVTLMLVNGAFDRLPADNIVNEVRQLMANE